MEKWKSESRPGKQLAAAVLSIVVGLVLVVGFHDFTGPGMTNSTAGFLLGVLLLAIGVLGFLVQGRQTVIVDPAARRITIEDRTRFGTKRRSIRFDDIVGVGIGYLGKRSNYVTCYYLVLKLKTGEEYPLFAPGRFYEGVSDRSVVEGWRMRLEKYILEDASAAVQG
ncbi:MAG TPA: hypothetical protein PLA83_02505 [Deltaproteobacteria bacterium]|nr:hypothetical protein [Deltaproteobacteria bacterium]HQH99833.1 hypothetical protein [Deltaproteobacteria bacterium]